MVVPKLLGGYFMAQRWAFEEDYLICKFAYEYMYNCFSDQEIECLMRTLKEQGFDNRSKESVGNRVRTYLRIFSGEENNDTTEQIESIAYAYLNKMASPRHTENHQIYQTHLPFGSYDDDLVDCTNLFAPEKQPLNNYVSLRPIAPSFKDLLLQYIQRSGRTASEVYNAAYVARDKFNHIINGRKGKNVKPNDNENKVNATHRTVMKLCLGLRLGYADAVYFMACAGYAFRPNEPVDMVVVECLKHEIWNMVRVNIELYEHKLELFSKKDNKKIQSKKQATS
jgi:hypothetical protein